MSFKEKVAEEARRQRELRAAGQPIPPELKRYARLSGLLCVLTTAVGAAVAYLVGRPSGSIFIGALLFFGALALLGLIQAVWGRNFLRR